MSDGFAFLVAARQCEVQDLQHTLQACEIVGAVTDMVHGLQKERGLSNGYLASSGQQFGDALPAQTQLCIALETHLRQRIDRLLPRAEAAALPHGTRLYSQIASVLQQLGALPDMRQRVQSLQTPANEAVAFYTQTIAGLLAVVFEAADSRSLGAGHPDIARLLLALFNLSQGKEYAGQERAWGTAFFAGSPQTLDSSAAQQVQWDGLVAQQDNCFALFLQFATPAQQQHWHGALEAPKTHIKDLRLQARQAPTTSAGSNGRLSRVWFECCTQRMDSMKLTEDLLAGQLLVLCERKLIERAKGLLMQQRQFSEAQAYVWMRQSAMNQSRRLGEVAMQVLAPHQGSASAYKTP